MNTRYQELAREAGLLVYNPDKMPTKLSVFAELLILECAKVIEDMTNPEDSDKYFWGMQNASQKIKDHFGVQK